MVGLINDIPSCKDFIERFVGEAETSIKQTLASTGLVLTPKL